MYKNSIVLNNPESLCQFQISSVDKPVNISTRVQKTKTFKKSRNSKVFLDKNSSVSFCNNFNPNIQIVIPSTKHLKNSNKLNIQTVSGMKKSSLIRLGKQVGRKKSSSRNSWNLSSKYSGDRLQRHSTFMNVPYQWGQL